MRLKLIIVLTFFCNAHSFAVLDFVFPFDNYITKEATVPVSWNKISSFSQYELQQSTDNTFTSNVTKYNVVGNSYTLNALQFDVNYYIRVRGVQAGVKTEWSPIVSFQRFSPAAIGGQQLWLLRRGAGRRSGCSRARQWLPRRPRRRACFRGGRRRLAGPRLRRASRLRR